ncbi:MAG: ribbon-helix-helix protein, CopG family [Planctomycetes bacterium]|nr:ribbon-helix-helix protein, CopG family [Planctomycetota bacterium]
MKRTTIFAEESLLEELKAISKEENKSISGVIREAMEGYVLQKRESKKGLSFIGISNSGMKDVAERHEELLWKETSK